MPNSVTAFIQQKVAMIIVPSWQILNIHATDPELKFKVVPIPKPPGGKNISLATYWVEGVSKMSKNQLEAWKFLKYLTEKDTMTKMYAVQSANRIFGEPYSRVDLAPLLIQNAYTGAVIKQAQDDVYVSLPLSSRTFDNGLNDEIIRYLENAINATIRGTSYNEALKTAKQGIDQIITRYKIE
jgi:multiple sugar transport system substrate-binding protein